MVAKKERQRHQAKLWWPQVAPFPVLPLPSKAGGRREGKRFFFHTFTLTTHNSQEQERSQLTTPNARTKQPNMAATPPDDVESGTATPQEIAAALSGITLSRSFPATLPECPFCHKKNVRVN